MPETLQSQSCILLYGRRVKDLRIRRPYPGHVAGDVQPPFLGANLFLQQQLSRDDSTIARIYAFSYEGHYYDLARPALFLVHGEGEEAETRVIEPGFSREAVAPETVSKTGVGASAKHFSERMRVWAYDKGDFSLRMDVRTGPLEQILLEPETSSDVLKTFFGGATARLRSPGSGGVGD